MKVLLTYIFFSPFLTLCQLPDSLQKQLYNEFISGTLDSTQINVSFTQNKFNQIDTLTTLYIVTDTIIDSTGIYSVGNIVLDPFLEYNNLKIGEWSEYYPNGILKSKGKYSIGAITYCQAGGPTVVGYNFKSGIWSCFFKNGRIKSRGKYALLTEGVKNSCGDDEYYISEKDANWQYWDIDGNVSK